MPQDDAPTITTAEDFERLLADPATTRAQLVSVKGSAQLWWQVLARCPEAAAWVAANRHLPLEIAEHLALHPSLPVRAALASGGCVPEQLMQRLAHDKSEFIRLRVVCNANASREVLMALAADPCQLVSAHAQARLVHDISGVALPASYLDDVSVLDLLH
ncbi:MAG: hypothetical protein AB1430_01035 [Pseudomonadota bacterium]